MFYSGPIHERAEHERALDTVLSSPQALEHAHMFLSAHNRPLVRYFALKIIEHWLTTRSAWDQLGAQAKEVIKADVSKSVCSPPSSASPPSPNEHSAWSKSLQVLALIGRLEWTPEDGSFFASIESLCHSKRVVGLALLRAVSDEFTSSSSSGSMIHQRAQAVKQLLASKASGILDFLTQVLTEAAASASTNEAQLAIEASAAYLSWLPLDVAINQSLFRALFHFARAGASASVADEPLQLSLQALQAVNELFSRPGLPKNAHRFIEDVFAELFSFVQAAATAAEASGQGASVAASLVNEDFLHEFTHFLRLFLSRHFRSLDAAATSSGDLSASARVDQFLHLLARFVFLSPNVEQVHESLGICLDLLDGLAAQSLHRPDTHRDALVSVQQLIVERLHFSQNYAFLQQLEDDCDDCDADPSADSSASVLADNELEQMRSRAVSCFALVAQMHTAETVESVFGVFERDLNRLSGLSSSATPVEQHATVRDCALALRLVASVAEELCSTPQLVEQTRAAFLSKALSLLQYCTTQRLYAMGSNSFVDLHCQVLGFFEPFAVVVAADQQSLASLLDALCSTLRSGNSSSAPTTPPPRILEMAAQVLRAVTTNARPPSLLEQAPMVSLISHLHPLAQSLPHSAQIQLYTAISNALVLLPSNQSIQSVNASLLASRYHSVFGPLVEGYQQLAAQSDFAQRDLNQLKLLADICSCICKELSGQPKFSRVACSATLKPALVSSILIIERRHRESQEPPHESIKSILVFFQSAVDSLKSELGREFVDQLMESLLTTCSAPNCQLLIASSATSSHQPHQQLVKSKYDLTVFITSSIISLFTFAANEPRPASANPLGFLSALLYFNLNTVYPRIAACGEGDCAEKLFEFLYAFLLTHWKTLTASPAGVALFTDAINCFIHSFSIGLPGCFSLALQLLLRLNEKLRLFSNLSFLSQCRDRFFDSLLNALISGGGSMNRQKDEIVSILFAIALVDFAHFGQFLQHYINKQEDLSQDQKTSLLTLATSSFDIDLPTFTQSIDSLVNDLIFFIKRN